MFWQRLYKARDHWVCKWIRDQPKKAFFYKNAGYKENKQVANAAWRRLSKDDRNHLLTEFLVPSQPPAQWCAAPQAK